MILKKCEDISKSIIKRLECSNCRAEVSEGPIYILNFAPNKNNGVGLVLCKNCITILKEEINSL